MKNISAAAYYKDDDSIATMEDALESTEGKSTILKSSTGSMNLLCAVSDKTPAPINTTNIVDDVIHVKESSVTSSTTMESRAQRRLLKCVHTTIKKLLA